MNKRKLLAFTLSLAISVSGVSFLAYESSKIEYNTEFDYTEIIEYTNNAYVEVNGNMPFFTEDEKLNKDPFENYSELDELGRCGVAYANICKELMPTEERGSIGMIKPSGWQTVRYDSLISGKYLYNRCHLIGYQLAGENANPLNLITGTRYLNIEGMLPFENKVDDYIEKNENNHVLYRVTPIFIDNNLIASGVLMEAYSVEDKGRGICFCVYCYNVQPGISIDYSNGDSCIINSDSTTETLPITFYLNSSTKKIHTESCKYASSSSITTTTLSYDELIEKGYSPCKICKPNGD